MLNTSTGRQCLSVNYIRCFSFDSRAFELRSLASQLQCRLVRIFHSREIYRSSTVLTITIDRSIGIFLHRFDIAQG